VDRSRAFIMGCTVLTLFILPLLYPLFERPLPRPYLVDMPAS